MEKNANYALVGLSSLILFVGLVIFVVWLARLQFTHEYDVYDVLFQGPQFQGSGGLIVQTYQCHGLESRANRFPHTDSNTGVDSSAYNLALDNQQSDYIAARAGRTVGEILADVLTMDANAAALDAAGIGAYTSLSPPTLPATTTGRVS